MVAKPASRVFSESLRTVSAANAIARPRCIKRSHRRRGRCTSGQSVQRYYDPAIGRFLSVDPVGPLEDPLQHFGRYHYANNNPYRYTDPDGRMPEFIENAIAGWSNTTSGALQTRAYAASEFTPASAAQQAALSDANSTLAVQGAKAGGAILATSAAAAVVTVGAVEAAPVALAVGRAGVSQTVAVDAAAGRAVQAGLNRATDAAIRVADKVTGAYQSAITSPAATTSMVFAANNADVVDDVLSSAALSATGGNSPSPTVYGTAAGGAVDLVKEKFRER